MASIVLLEDEAILRQELAGFLERRGHRVSQAGSLAAFWPLMAAAEIAIIDIMLPDGEGFEAAQRLREASPRAGVILLTARSATADKLQGLYGGADHYLVKPFKLIELAAIIDVLMRRVGIGWRLDMLAHALISPDGLRLELSPSEMTLCALFCAANGAIVSRRQIVEALGYTWRDFDMRRLDTLISRFRQRWSSAHGRPLPIKTEHRVGYSFGARMGNC